MSEVLFKLDEGVGTIILNRPEQRNALNPSMLSGLRAALADAGGNRDVYVIAITGAGEKAFCAGADLKSALSDETGPKDFGRRAYYRLLLDILECPKPTVALARGHVMAGGLGLLLACDLALACDDVWFSTPEIQVGMFPMMVLALLYRHVGRKKTAEMVMLGERMQADAAAQCGLVNRVYPRSRFEASSSEFLRKLAGSSSAILKAGKEAIRHVEDRGLPEELDFLEEALARVMSSGDSREGIRAFLEKRRPIWGRPEKEGT